MELESYRIASVIYVRMRMRIHTHAHLPRAIYPLLDIRSRARNWVQTFPIKPFNFPLFFRITFSFNFFTIGFSGLFQSFFSKWSLIVEMKSLILFCLMKLDEIYRAERLYHNGYPFRWHPNAMQIRILLRECRRIRKRNRKQIRRR